MIPIRQSLSLAGASSETKFLVPASKAEEVLDWARRSLTPDEHADPVTGFYQVTTLYLDTPDQAVFRRKGSHAHRKYRVRRYGNESVLHLERKLKRKGQVRKMRWLTTDSEWRQAELGDAAYWFRRRIQASQLVPAAVVSYERAAFFGPDFRLTLDRNLRIAEAESSAVRLPAEALELAADSWILEVKHTGALPGLVRECVLRHKLVQEPFSKYRDGVRALRLALTPA